MPDEFLSLKTVDRRPPLFGKYGERLDGGALTPAEASELDPFGESACAQLAFRLSRPVNLNTYTPSIYMLRDDKKQTNIYDVDENGIATDLRTDILEYPFATLLNRGSATRQLAEYSDEYEKYYWPSYLMRAAPDDSTPLRVMLENTGRPLSHVTLTNYMFNGDVAQDVVVVRLAGIRGGVLSNNLHVNGAFAVIRNNKVYNGVVAERPCSDIASASVSTLQRSLEVRLFDTHGNPLKSVSVSMWFSLYFK